MSRPQGSKYYCLPANYTHITVPFSKNHTAVDYGFIYGHENPPLVAISDAVVVNNSKNSETGNTIAIGWDKDGFTWYVEYMHNAKYAELSVGTQVKQGDRIGTMGTTGKSTGVHVHLILYKVPLGTPFKNSSNNRVNANDYCFRFPNQTVTRDNKLIKDVPKETVGDLTEVKGVLKVTAPKGLNERVAPSTDAKVVKTNAKGTKLNYVGWLSDGKYYWYKLTNGNYAAYRVINGQKFAEYKDDVAQEPKPPTFKPYSYNIPKGSTLYSRSGSPYSAKTTNAHTVTITEEVNGLGRFKTSWLQGVSEAYVKLGSTPSKPASNVGKTANFKGVYLYLSSTASQPARAKANASYSLKILAEANGRYQVRDAKFNPNTVWVRAQDVKVK